MIRLVEKHKDETRGSTKASVPSSTKTPCASRRDTFLANVESTVCLWLKDETPKRVVSHSCWLMKRSMTLWSPQGPPPGYPQEFCLVSANTILSICLILLQAMKQEIITIITTFKICYLPCFPRYLVCKCQVGFVSVTERLQYLHLLTQRVLMQTYHLY